MRITLSQADQMRILTINVRKTKESGTIMLRVVVEHDRICFIEKLLLVKNSSENCENLQHLFVVVFPFRVFNILT